MFQNDQAADISRAVSDLAKYVDHVDESSAMRVIDIFMKVSNHLAAKEENNCIVFEEAKSAKE